MNLDRVKALSCIFSLHTLTFKLFGRPSNAWFISLGIREESYDFPLFLAIVIANTPNLSLKQQLINQYSILLDIQAKCYKDKAI
jgi:hypothetical protein